MTFVSHVYEMLTFESPQIQSHVCLAQISPWLEVQSDQSNGFRFRSWGFESDVQRVPDPFSSGRSAVSGPKGVERRSRMSLWARYRGPRM